MKKIILPLLMFGLTTQAQDLFLQTRMEQGTLSALVDKTRLLMSNAEINDRMTGEVNFTDDVSISLKDLEKDADYTQFRDLFTSVFKVNLRNATLRLRIPQISYQLEQLHAKPLSMRVDDPTLNLEVTAMIRGLTTALTKGLDLDLMIPNPKTSQPESYLTAHLVPTTIILPKDAEPLSFNIEFETKRDQEFTYRLKNYDLTTIPSFIDRQFNTLRILETGTQNPISAGSISVNPVMVRLASFTRTIHFDTFKPLLQKKLNYVLSSIMTTLGRSLQDRIGPRILKNVFSNKTRSDLVVKNEHLYTRFATSNFSQPVSDQLYLGVIGELCKAESYQQYHEQCPKQETFPAPVRSISEGDRQKANSEVTENIARGTSDLILSLSEEYLNRLLSLTIQANLWNESLEKHHLAVGPKGAFVVFDQRTQNPELYLDVIYSGDGKGVKGLLVNSNKPIRFPLRLSTSLGFVNQDGIPHLVIKTQKVLSDSQEIIDGIPQYGLASDLVWGLKKKIAGMILKMSMEIEGQTAVDLALPVLKNIDLEKTSHEASPFGRLHLFFKL